MPQVQTAIGDSDTVPFVEHAIEQLEDDSNEAENLADDVTPDDGVLHDPTSTQDEALVEDVVTTFEEAAE